MAFSLALPVLASSVAILDFFDDFGWVALLLTVYLLYNRLSYSFIKEPIIALIMVGVITFALLIPFPWFKWVMFIGFTMYGFWGKVDFATGGGGH